MSTLKSFFTLLAVSLIVALVHNAGRPYPIVLSRPLPALAPGDVSLSAAKTRLKDSSTLFIDARPQAVYSRGHIPGALQLTPVEFQTAFPSLKDRLQGKKLIVYCSGPRCPKAERVQRSLQGEGFEEVLVLRVGYKAWLEAGLPVERSP